MFEVTPHKQRWPYLSPSSNVVPSVGFLSLNVVSKSSPPQGNFDLYHEAMPDPLQTLPSQDLLSFCQISKSLPGKTSESSLFPPTLEWWIPLICSFPSEWETFRAKAHFFSPYISPFSNTCVEDINTFFYQLPIPPSPRFLNAKSR